MNKRKKKKANLVLIFFLGFLAVLILTVAALAISVSVSNTTFTDQRHFFVVEQLDNVNGVIERLEQENLIVSKIPCYVMVFVYHKIFGKEIYPGRYEISRGHSTWQIFDALYTGKQQTIKIVINKFRQWGNFIQYLQSKIPIDSAEFTQDFIQITKHRNDMVEASELFAYIIPDTYYCFWTSSPQFLAEKLYSNYVKFWNDERLQKLKQLGLTPYELFILASLVEEETNNLQDKPMIASVFYNRFEKRMYLGSCPSIKYSLKDFALRRILKKHLDVVSPYNTYRHLGFPPGPICTPSIATLDATLDAPKTDYFYFVASSEEYDRHLFSTSYAEHLKKARIYVNKIFMK